jgi:hypothetical protein
VLGAQTQTQPGTRQWLVLHLAEKVHKKEGPFRLYGVFWRFFVIRGVYKKTPQKAAWEI